MKQIKYYNLKGAWEPKIIGVKDGGSQAEFIKDGFKNKFHFDEIIQFKDLSNQANYGNIPSFTINLEYVKMRKGARLTDFISFYPHIPFAEYLVSDRVVNILSTFKLCEHKFYPATIDYNGKIISNYKLMYISPIEILKNFEISQSLFFKGFEIEPKNFFTFQSDEDFINFSKENYIKAKKLKASKTFDKDLDFFIARLPSDIFISGDLKETFEIAGITGINIVEATQPEIIFTE